MNIRPHLETALKFAKSTCFIGSGNKIKDVAKTGGWACDVATRRFPGYFAKQLGASFRSKHSTWTYEVEEEKLNLGIESYSCKLNTDDDPLNDPRFNLSNSLQNLLMTALVTQKTKAGNCRSLSCLIAKYLWENNQGINKIELVDMKNYDHAFIIVNRPDNSDLNDASTWGSDTWCIDAWYEDGIIFSAAEFNSQMKKTTAFAEKQSLLLSTKEIDWEFHTDPDTDFTLETECTILPQQNHYPTYSTSPFYPLEHYYNFDVCEDDIEDDKQFDPHDRMNACLSEYKQWLQTNFSLTQESAMKYKQALESIPANSLSITEKKSHAFLIKKLDAFSNESKDQIQKLMTTQALIKTMISLFRAEYKKLSSSFPFWMTHDAITTLNKKENKHAFSRCIGLILKDILRVNDRAALQSTIKTSFNFACLEKLQPHKMFPMLAKMNTQNTALSCSSKGKI